MKMIVAAIVVAAIAAAFALPGAAQLPAAFAAPAALPLEAAADPSTAWLMAIGFLAVIVFRRLGD